MTQFLPELVGFAFLLVSGTLLFRWYRVSRRQQEDEAA
jgi:hypothetical protein